MCKCDSIWILEPWYYIDCISIVRRIKCDVTEGLGVKCMAHHWSILFHEGLACYSLKPLADLSAELIKVSRIFFCLLSERFLH